VRDVTRSRRWAVPLAIAALAVAFLVAGAVTWEMTTPKPSCPTRTAAVCGTRPHHHHPLRAELLWAGAGLLGIIAFEVALWQRKQIPMPRTRSTASRFH
jgi:hypothetical protein